MNILSKLSFPPLVQRVYILFPFLQHSFTSLGLFYSSLFSVSSTLDAVCHFFIVVAIVLFVAEKYFSLLGIHCEREYIVLLVLSFVQPFSRLFFAFFCVVSFVVFHMWIGELWYYCTFLPHIHVATDSFLLFLRFFCLATGLKRYIVVDITMVRLKSFHRLLATFLLFFNSSFRIMLNENKMEYGQKVNGPAVVFSPKQSKNICCIQQQLLEWNGICLGGSDQNQLIWCRLEIKSKFSTISVFAFLWKLIRYTWSHFEHPPWWETEKKTIDSFTGK